MAIVDHRAEGDSLLRQCQLTELYLFDVFLDICRKYDLKYFIYGGTLLGAARHNGFIPWDDDIDVAMPLCDYRKFLKIAPYELPENLLLTPGREYGGMESFAKIRDRSSFMCEKYTNVEQPCGMFIDIFPYEKIPKLPKKIGWPLAYWCYMSWVSARIHRTIAHRSIAGVFISGIKASIWMLICQVLCFVHRFLRLMMPCVWRCSPYVPLYQYHQGFSESDIFPLRKISFEGRECFAPNDVDAYLTQYYGDWRKLPPPEKRQWHASIICPTQAPDAPWARKWEGSDI